MQACAGAEVVLPKLKAKEEGAGSGAAQYLSEQQPRQPKEQRLRRKKAWDFSRALGPDGQDGTKGSRGIGWATSCVLCSFYAMLP